MLLAAISGLQDCFGSNYGMMHALVCLQQRTPYSTWAPPTMQLQCAPRPGPGPEKPQTLRSVYLGRGGHLQLFAVSSTLGQSRCAAPCSAYLVVVALVSPGCHPPPLSGF